jgi:hypothetical protein
MHSYFILFYFIDFGFLLTRVDAARVEVELHIMSYLSESELNTVALLSNVPPLSQALSLQYLAHPT